MSAKPLNVKKEKFAPTHLLKYDKDINVKVFRSGDFWIGRSVKIRATDDEIASILTKKKNK